MTKPMHSHSDKNGFRTYVWPETNETFDSVTTILSNGHPKTALPYWAARNVAAYVVEHFDEVSGLMKTYEPKKVIDSLRIRPDIYTKERGTIGDLIHSSIEDYIRWNRRPLTRNPLVEEALDKFEMFVEDWKPEFLHTEATVYSRKYGYAGTPDDIIKINDIPIIIDLKSGKGVWNEAALQMSAYKNADFIGINDTEIPLPDIQGAAVLHLFPESEAYEFIPVYIGDEVFEQFLRAHETYKFNYKTAPDIRLIFRHITPVKAAKLNGKTPKWVIDLFRDRISSLTVKK